MRTGEFLTGIFLVLICEFVYVFICKAIWRQFPFNLYATGIYVARNFCRCPACASSVDL